MRYKTSMIALLLGLGIYGIAPVIGGLEPFAAPSAFAKSGSGHDGGGDNDHSGHGNGGHGGDDDDHDDGHGGHGDDDDDDDDDVSGADDDDGTPDQGHGDTCVRNCNG
jgi:hypothetical protein